VVYLEDKLSSGVGLSEEKDYHRESLNKKGGKNDQIRKKEERTVLEKKE